MFIHIVIPYRDPGDETAIREAYAGTPEEIILKAIDRTAGFIFASLLRQGQGVWPAPAVAPVGAIAERQSHIFWALRCGYR